MKTLLILVFSIVSLSASAAKWVPKTKAEHDQIWKIILSLDYSKTKSLLESGLHPDLSGQFEPGINERNGEGPSPIIFIVQKLNRYNLERIEKLIELFLKHGADISLVPNPKLEIWPQTAFAMIPEGNCFDYKNEPEYLLSVFLIERGYDANAGNPIIGKWHTALISRPMCGPIAELLLSRGVDPAESDCFVYQKVYDSYMDEGGLEGDLEYQRQGFPPHSLNYFRKALTKRYGQGNPNFDPDAYCKF